MAIMFFCHMLFGIELLTIPIDVPPTAL